MLAELWKRHGLSPAWLFNDLTPFEVLHLFGEKVEPLKRDPVADLHQMNHLARAGERPAVPSWLMKEVPRRGRPQ